jgi:hypothetical protein
MVSQEINLDALKAKLRNIRAGMSRATWSELLVDITSALLVEESGYIVDATKPADLMFGYIPGELAGKPLKILIPNRFWSIHDQHWERYWSNPIARAMGSRIEEGSQPTHRKLDIIGIMKDKTEKNLTIGLYPLTLAESRCAIALISERF